MPDALFHGGESIPVICRDAQTDRWDFQRADAPVLLPHLFNGRQRVLRRFPVKIRIGILRNLIWRTAASSSAAAGAARITGIAARKRPASSVRPGGSGCRKSIRKGSA